MQQCNFALVIAMTETGNQKLPGQGVLNGSCEKDHLFAFHDRVGVGMFRSRLILLDRVGLR
jgi:hypothetical protein